MATGIIVFAEQVDGAFRKVAFETVSEGRKLADVLNAPLTAVVLGGGVEDMASQLQAYGADKILVADDEALQEYTTDAYTNVLADMIKNVDPQIVLLGASTRGKDLAARLAARLDAGLVTDCISLTLEDGALVATKPVFGGKVLASIAVKGIPQIAAIRPNVMEMTASEKGGTIETVSANIGAVKTSILEKKVEASTKVDLTEADIVVSGGRGMGGNDFTVVEGLAQVLGAAVGASRSAVDEGWRPHSDQVGQTGKVVSPNLYIACGISGAIQHLAGMGSSKYIVAINKDPDAPIFRKADFGIVGDLFEVVPALTKEIEKLKE